jgi:chemotaxis protein MotA
MADQARPLTAAPTSRPIVPRPSVTRPDFATFTGLILAFGAIVGGLILEGGKLKDITQLTAAIIVLGGTSGAVMVSTPMNILWGGARRRVDGMVG